MNVLVDLRDVGHPETPIIIDTSPPLPGNVTDGVTRGIDIDYQNSTTSYCATWEGFTDPESGICKFHRYVIYNANCDN